MDSDFQTIVPYIHHADFYNAVYNMSNVPLCSIKLIKI